MRKKGFTLIELLAVIVILAIIALIAVPIVLNIIEDTKNSATLRSADFYIDAVELSIAQKVLDGGSIDGEYSINTNGDICRDEDCIEVEVGGQKPTGGKIIIESGKIKDLELALGGKTVIKDSDGKIVLNTNSDTNSDTNLSPEELEQKLLKYTDDYKIAVQEAIAAELAKDPTYTYVETTGNESEIDANGNLTLPFSNNNFDYKEAEIEVQSDSPKPIAGSVYVSPSNKIEVVLTIAFEEGVLKSDENGELKLIEYNMNIDFFGIDKESMVVQGYSDVIIDFKSEGIEPEQLEIAYKPSYSNSYDFRYAKEILKYTYEEGKLIIPRLNHNVIIVKFDKICMGVKEQFKSEYVEGIIPTGNYSIGDEYLCQFASGNIQNVFVLSKNLNASSNIESINFLTNEFDSGLMGGCGNAEDGPTNGLYKLNSFTTNWTNIDNIIMDYTDEGGNYGSIKTTVGEDGNTTTQITKKDGTVTETITNLKARMPYKYELEELPCVKNGSGFCFEIESLASEAPKSWYGVDYKGELLPNSSSPCFNTKGVITVSVDDIGHFTN